MREHQPRSPDGGSRPSPKRTSVGRNPGYNSFGHHRTVARMEAAGRNPGRALREMMTVLLPGLHPGYHCIQSTQCCCCSPDAGPRPESGVDVEKNNDGASPRISSGLRSAVVVARMEQRAPRRKSPWVAPRRKSPWVAPRRKSPWGGIRGEAPRSIFSTAAPDYGLRPSSGLRCCG